MSTRLQPLTRIWLFSQLQHELRPASDIKTLIIFGWVGLIILVIACTNYINLATARSMSKIREIGIRRVMGASVPRIFWMIVQEFARLVLLAATLFTVSWQAGRAAGANPADSLRFE